MLFGAQVFFYRSFGVSGRGGDVRGIGGLGQDGLDVFIGAQRGGQGHTDVLDTPQVMAWVVVVKQLEGQFKGQGAGFYQVGFKRGPGHVARGHRVLAVQMAQRHGFSDLQQTFVVGDVGVTHAQ